MATITPDTNLDENQQQPPSITLTYPEEDLLREINHVKTQHRSSMELNDWAKRKYAHIHSRVAHKETKLLEDLDTIHNGKRHPQAVTPLDATTKQRSISGKGQTGPIKGIDRVLYTEFSAETFQQQYEDPSKPVMIIQSITTNPSDETYWPSMGWDLTSLATGKYKKAKFRIGDDDDGRAMRIPLDMYIQYLESSNDDSPLYLFEDDFGERPDSTQMINEYKPPKFFQEDIFLLTPLDRRPPFRWFIAGSQRCGTKVHIDPLGTSAWNGLISGCKRWVLFSPQTPLSIANGSFLFTPEEKLMGRSYEAIEYFDLVLPRIRTWIRGLSKEEQEKYQMMEFLQYPGEVVFVPNSWPHAVMNHCLHGQGGCTVTSCAALAFTQNWASPYIGNFKEIWKFLCNRRRYLARRLYDRLQVFYPELATQIETIFKNDTLNTDHHYEPQHDPNMRPRRIKRRTIEQLIEHQKQAKEQIETLFPNYFTDVTDPKQQERAINVMLEGNSDSSDDSSDDESSDSSDSDSSDAE